MPTRANFADPDREPTDEELAQFAKEAFAGIAEANETRLREMRARIAVAGAGARAAALARMAELTARR